MYDLLFSNTRWILAWARKRTEIVNFIGATNKNTKIVRRVISKLCSLVSAHSTRRTAGRSPAAKGRSLAIQQTEWINGLPKSSSCFIHMVSIRVQRIVARAEKLFKTPGPSCLRKNLILSNELIWVELPISFPGLFSAEERKALPLLGGEKPWERGWLNYHREKLRKLTFRALALSQSG